MSGGPMLRSLVLAATLAATAAVASACGGARADDQGDVLTGTLKAVAGRGTILIGYREDAVPFSFLNQARQPIGFSLDLCHGIASDVARALNRELLEPDAPAWQTGVRLAYVPVTADARIPSVVSGAVDLECGSTTATAERAETVAFSPVFFLAGTRLMVPLERSGGGSPVASYHDLAGRTVVVGAGTRNAQVMHRLAGNLSPPMTVVEAPGLESAYQMLVAGEADAFASDDTLLAGYGLTHPDGSRFAIVGDYLSYEPYAITLRRDDPAFADLVRRSFERMAGEGTLTRLYNRWFTRPLPSGKALNLSMSAQLTEMYRALGQPD